MSLMTQVVPSICSPIRLTRALAVLASVQFAGGCSVHPLPDDVSRKTTYDVVDKIRCEAKAAVQTFGQGFQNASIVYTFTFDINEQNGAEAGFTLFNPFANGTFNVAATGGSNRIRAGNRNFELIDSFDDLRKMNCTRDREANWVYPLTGDVGMYDSVATFIRLQRADNPGSGRIFTFADTLTYTTTFTGGVGATLTLQPVSEQFKFTAANAGLSGSRTDVHKVVVTMAAGHQVFVDQSGRRSTRRSVPLVDARFARSNGGRDLSNRNGDPASGGWGAGDGAVGVAGGFNNLLSTRMLQQESSAENRALYEQDRQRQLELQRRSLDVRVLVGP
ncbi:hypothetical protein GA0061098_10583 [Bradyrhizobium shewense]|uniref:Uncharacterized protein n=1 Tax=Bradyrhizobium shewense TaxID=1761772 RepID=A0A1C3XUB7_9BRAD|nr:hypothetical protein [Bradyrhizobium shewense]SCB55873.1 hypothetical protein GA0061098_10583 [Bradyrhizobium shewense]